MTVALMMLLLVTAPPLMQCGLIPMSAADQQETIDFHNKMRRHVVPPAADMNAMGWDASLATLAETAASSCVFSHNYGGDFAGKGENLYKGHRTNFTEILMMMYLEREIYNFSTAQCLPGPTSKYPMFSGCGHYLQLSDAAVSRVGCAVADCGGFKLAACEYDRMYRSPPYAAGEAGTKCGHVTTGYSYDKLCYSTWSFMPQPPAGAQLECKITCMNGGTRVEEHGSCKCNCPNEFVGVRCETPATITVIQSNECEPMAVTCHNGGTPTMQNGVCKCVCGSDFGGEFCERSTKIEQNSVIWYFGMAMRYQSYYPVDQAIITNALLNNSLMYFVGNAINELCKTNYTLCCPEASSNENSADITHDRYYSITPNYPADAIDGSLMQSIYFNMETQFRSTCNLGISPMINRNTILEASKVAYPQIQAVANVFGVNVIKYE